MIRKYSNIIPFIPIIGVIIVLLYNDKNNEDLFNLKNPKRNISSALLQGISLFLIMYFINL